MTYSPITDTRIDSALAQLGVQTGRSDDGEVVAAFEDAQIVFITDGGLTTAQAHWMRGTYDEDQADLMREVLNRLNMIIPLGKAVTATSEWGATMAFRHHFFSSSGVSDAQLVAMFDLYLKVTFFIINELEATFPNTVSATEA